MEKLSAKVTAKDDKHFITIDMGDEELQIPMSDDKPSKVKKAFNRLLLRLKKGPFAVELEDVGEDLFAQVAKEYINQLNKEVKEVRAEMVEQGLVKE